MREMTDKEMLVVVDAAKWATICTASLKAEPYAVEATPFFMDGDTCFMINPRGGTHRNVRENPSVLLKYALASRDLSWWAGVSGFGSGRFDPDPDAIVRGFDLLGDVMKADYAAAGEKFAAMPERSPLFRVTMRTMTGRCSVAVGEPLFPASRKREGEKSWI